jgi:prophage tail gpP-like protein
MADEELRVLVRGKEFTDWESVTIRRSVLAAAGSFQLRVGPVSPWPFKPPVPVAIDWADHRMVTGYVEETKGKLATRERTVAGRDRTGDLVDCDPDPDGPHVWQNATIDAVARDLAKSVNVRVETRGDLGAPFPRYVADPGEKIFAAIEKGLRQRGVLGFCRGDGVLFLATPSTTREAVFLESGVNLKDADFTDSTVERFSTYVVRGQRIGSGDDFVNVPTAPEGRAEDLTLGRDRPLVIVAGGNVTEDVARQRAQWEATVRAAKSQQVVAFVQDWAKYRNHDGTPGPLWRVDELVHLKCPQDGVETDLYVSEVVYRRDRRREGTTAELTLVRPDAFTPQPKILQDSDPFFGVFAQGEQVGAPTDPDEMDLELEDTQ